MDEIRAEKPRKRTHDRDTHSGRMADAALLPAEQEHDGLKHQNDRCKNCEFAHLESDDVGRRIHDKRIQPETHTADRNGVKGDAVYLLIRIRTIDIDDVCPVSNDRLAFEPTAVQNNVGITVAARKRRNIISNAADRSTALIRNRDGAGGRLCV